MRRGQYPEAIGREEAWIAERLRQHRDPRKPIEQQTADGRWIRILERRTATGETVGLRVDITEIKEREAALHRSEERLRATMDATPDCILCVDGEGRAVDVNQAVETVFGYRRADIIGRVPVDIVIPERFRAALKEGLRLYVEEDKVPDGTVRHEIRGLRPTEPSFPARSPSPRQSRRKNFWSVICATSRNGRSENASSGKPRKPPKLPTARSRISSRG